MTGLEDCPNYGYFLDASAREEEATARAEELEKRADFYEAEAEEALADSQRKENLIRILQEGLRMNRETMQRCEDDSKRSRINYLQQIAQLRQDRASILSVNARLRAERNELRLAVQRLRPTGMRIQEWVYESPNADPVGPEPDVEYSDHGRGNGYKENGNGQL